MKALTIAAPGRSAPIVLPLRGSALAALTLAFLLPGLWGHDPWKTEDAIGFGIVFDMLDRGTWLTPSLAGEAYYEDGPLYYWVSALFARLAAPILPLHDGARIATLVSMAFAFYFTRLAARELYGKRAGDLSAIALLGCLGLLVHAHEVTAEAAMLALVAAAYYGLSIAWKKPVKAAFCFGAGAGGAFLAKGLVAFVPPLVAAVILLPLAYAERARAYVQAVTLGLLIALPVALAWPFALREWQPQYLDAWLIWQWNQLIGVPRWTVSSEYLKTLAWAAWPAWPLAIWAAWEYRRELRNPGFAVPFVACVVSLATLLLNRSPRELDALALLVPLSIPAGAAAIGLRRGAANALAWFSLMTFSLIAIALWVTWFAMMTGFPARIATNVAKLEPGFVPQLSLIGVGFALLYSLAWGWFAMRAEVSTLRSLPFWSCGVTLIWGVAMSLWISWIDYGKSYRPVAVAVQNRIGPDATCVASRGLGDVQRAVFHYHGALLTERRELGHGARCNYLLIQASSARREVSPGRDWMRIWEGARPRDRERYRLYRRNH